MEIEVESSHSVFSQVQRKDLDLLNITNSDIIFEIEVSFQQFQAPTHRLSLIKSHVLLLPINPIQADGRQN